MELSSNAELMAEKAESLKAFSGLKLLHIKKNVASILNLIGRDGIFDEYTKHDISHIDYMLNSLDEIIPKNTQQLLTPADWLMITLSIYFHDLGMLVTKSEFKNRHKTIFTNFKQLIIDGQSGLDYRDKILSITNSDDQDRFIYQELVRKTHAERIRSWILSEKNPSFDIESTIINEINTLLSVLDNMFRRDLALVCESHHLSDLEDFDKYKTSQQYGPTKSEIVNLHYAALILRTADLLHITSDRTPSIEFSLINPSDPISQEEWAKQRSVKAIRPQSKKNKDGFIDEQIAKDTFEVIALFEDENGFFGLISYLDYASKQLKENFKYNELSKKLFATQYEYPWKNIDDTSIEANNFDKRQFEFVLDQTKILDLLVGHTLYNDYTVVLRELTQNAIDASKLKKHEIDNTGKKTEYEPKIKITWKENERELSFLDNGTGMTLEIIQNHLLKVGSSRYQDDTFKKQFPNFSSISRFGIGLLTCFLIADDIDIITKSSESEKAILLKIKKVHGKYLLKYVNSDNLPPEIKSHGTVLKLSVRSEVKLDNIENELRKWILIPNCEIILENDGIESVIGFSSPKEAITAHLQQIGYDVDDKTIKVKEETHEGITLAYALRYIEHWNEWTFFESMEAEKLFSPIGTYIEGIKVDFKTPGFNSINLYSIVNTTGIKAPKTNVARSNIEVTPEKRFLLNTIYRLYLNHISDELENLLKEGFSITWAANEANFLLNSFIRNYRSYNVVDSPLEDIGEFTNILSNVESILIEQKGHRQLINFNKLRELQHFWIIDCASYTSADSLLKEIKATNTSALSLLNTIFDNEDSNTSHIDNLFCNFQPGGVLDKIIRESFQVDVIKLVPKQRRIDLRWSYTDKKIWYKINLSEDHRRDTVFYIQLEDIEIIDSMDEIAISSSNNLFILKNSELNHFLVNLINKLGNTQEDKLVISNLLNVLSALFNYKDINSLDIEQFLQSRLESNKNRDLSQLIWSKVNKSELISAILKTNFITYDTNVWYRRNEYLF